MPPLTISRSTGRSRSGRKSEEARCSRSSKRAASDTRVAAEDVLEVDKVKGEPGEIVEFGEVLVVGGDSVTLGAPRHRRGGRGRGARTGARCEDRVQKAPTEELVAQDRPSPGIRAVLRITTETSPTVASSEATPSARSCAPANLLASGFAGRAEVAAKPSASRWRARRQGGSKAKEVMRRSDDLLQITIMLTSKVGFGAG